MTTATIKGVISLDSSGLKTGLKEAGESANGLNNKFSGIAKGMGQIAGAVGAFAIVGTAIKSLADNASNISDLSQATGIASSNIQKLGVAANVAGMGSESFFQSLDKLRNAQGEALAGNVKTQETFSNFGISLTDLASLKPDELFARISKSMQSFGNDPKAFSSLRDLMGAKATDLLGVMDALNKGVGNNIPIISDDDLKRLALMKQENMELAESVKAWGMNVGTKLLNLFGDAQVGMKGLGSGLGSWFAGGSFEDGFQSSIDN